MANLTKWLKQTLCLLNLTDSMNQPSGFTRLGFSKEERLSHEAFRQIASELGLKTWEDEVGNQWALWEADPSAPTIGMGSHLDTVVEGGGYDGVAGIACGLGAIRKLKRKNIKLQKNIAVICFISEESARFGISTIGSKTVVGDVDKQTWEKVTDKDHVTIRQAMEAYGINWNTFEKAYCEKSRLESFLELHIEQGSYLYNHQKDIGIVRGIATPIRLQVTAYGQSNHTGTTHMGERKDAFVAISPLVDFVYKKATEINKTSAEPLMATVSTVNISPNMMNVIPGQVELGIDIRSVDDELKRQFANTVIGHSKQLGKKYDVEVTVDVLVDEPSVMLDETIRKKLVTTCEELGTNISYDTMNSGAGHDVMNIAKRWPSGLIFIPSVNGMSHHPDEFTPIHYLEIGVSVLAKYLEREAGDTIQ